MLSVIRTSGTWPQSDTTASTLALSVLSTASGLYDWAAPERPEDLAFYTVEGTVFWGSISHEREAWLSLSSLRLSELAGNRNPVADARIAARRSRSG